MATGSASTLMLYPLRDHPDGTVTAFFDDGSSATCDRVRRWGANLNRDHQREPG